jgi:hypothetical protein
MVAAIRQTVTIKDDGAIEVRSPELRAGEHAEVIVLLNQPASAQGSSMTPLEALKALQESLNLTPEAAQKWIDEARTERETWGNRG